MVDRVLDRLAGVSPPRPRAGGGAASIRILFGAATGDPTADAIIAQLRAAGGSLTRWQLNNALGHNVRQAEIARALELLQRTRAITRERAGTGGSGRRPERITLYEEYEENEEIPPDGEIHNDISELGGHTHNEEIQTKYEEIGEREGGEPISS